MTTNDHIEVFRKQFSNENRAAARVETLIPAPLCVGHNGAGHLTDGQIQMFHKQGFLCLQELITYLELSDLKTTLELLLKNEVGKKEGARADLNKDDDDETKGNSLQLNNPINFAPTLHDTQCFRTAISIAKQLLGEDTRCLWDFAIMKKAKTGTRTPWHQDEAFRDPRFEYNELTIWIPMQDTDSHSSCLQFIPGSHLRGVLKHGSPDGNSGSHSLQCAGDFDLAAAVAGCIPAGGCTIHHQRTLHYAGPNSSDHPRLAYILTFGTAPKPSSVLRSFPWLEKRQSDAQRRRRQWMWHGGLFVTAWRKLRRGELTDWRSLSYGIKRSLEVLRSGR